MLSRYGEKEDVEALAQRAMSRFDGFGENEAPLGKCFGTLNLTYSPF